MSGYCDQVQTQAPALWAPFIARYNLSPMQAEQFAHYALLLQEWNEKHNLTSITDMGSIIADHFGDSLSITEFIDFTAIKGMSDIGSGGGFPGIPLKILYPHIPVVLIEISGKKVQFLNEVITLLGLEGIEVSSLDWRTFLRKTNYTIDLFCARASLRPDELVRALSDDNCPYNKAQIVYWASQYWEMGKKERKYFAHQHEYMVNDKQRLLIVFKRP